MPEDVSDLDLGEIDLGEAIGRDARTWSGEIRLVLGELLNFEAILE